MSLYFLKTVLHDRILYIKDKTLDSLYGTSILTENQFSSNIVITNLSAVLNETGFFSEFRLSVGGIVSRKKMAYSDIACSCIRRVDNYPSLCSVSKGEVHVCYC